MAISARPISSEKKMAEVERQRRLSEGGARRDDDELPGVEAVGEVVEVGEPGGDTGHVAVFARRGLDLVGGRGERDGERNVVFGLDVAVHGVDLGLGVVHEVHDLALAGVAHLHDARAGFDETTQHGLLGDDVGVVAGVRRGGNEARECVQVFRAARAAQLADLGELVGDGDDVGGLAVRIEGEHGVEDDLVLGDVEVGAAHDLDDVGHSVFAQQHSTECALLGQQVVRGSAVAPGIGAPFARGTAGGVAAPLAVVRAGQSQVGYRHGSPFVCALARFVHSQLYPRRPTSLRSRPLATG
jgi:hypothetical protein